MSGEEALPPLRVEWYCGSCAGRGWLWCSECVAGCKDCQGLAQVECWQCRGNRKAVPPPDWR